VDWKRLVQFALLGSSGLEQYAILLVRVSIGCSSPSPVRINCSPRWTKPVYETLVKAKVPFPARPLISCRVWSSLADLCWPWDYCRVRPRWLC